MCRPDRSGARRRLRMCIQPARTAGRALVTQGRAPVARGTPCASSQRGVRGSTASGLAPGWAHAQQSEGAARAPREHLRGQHGAHGPGGCVAERAPLLGRRAAGDRLPIPQTSEKENAPRSRRRGERGGSWTPTTQIIGILPVPPPRSGRYSTRSSLVQQPPASDSGTPERKAVRPKHQP